MFKNSIVLRRLTFFRDDKSYVMYCTKIELNSTVRKTFGFDLKWYSGCPAMKYTCVWWHAGKYVSMGEFLNCEIAGKTPELKVNPIFHRGVPDPAWDQSDFWRPSQLSLTVAAEIFEETPQDKPRTRAFHYKVSAFILAFALEWYIGSATRLRGVWCLVYIYAICRWPL